LLRQATMLAPFSQPVGVAALAGQQRRTATAAHLLDRFANCDFS